MNILASIRQRTPRIRQIAFCRGRQFAASAAANVAAAEPSPTSSPAAVASPQRQPSPLQQLDTQYDVFIVGGGITGSALLYELSHFTDLKRLALVERRNDFATIASGPNNNSQTIHCGDIETNYSSEKARIVKKQADMMRNYATKLPEEMQKNAIFKMQKMVMGVGDEECYALEQRYEKLKELFPRMELTSKTKLRSIEPNVVRISNQRDRKDNVNAIVVHDEHAAVNYHSLTHSFIQQSKEAGLDGLKTVDIKTNTEVKNISQNEDETFTIHTTRGNIRSRFVVVSACGYSLLFAQKLGYGLKYGCFPVAGSFYFSKTPVLNGKVYTVQDPKLPFAAVHGDPDVHAVGMTRFGPTALPMPLLERFNLASFKDFLKVANFDLKLLVILLGMFTDPTMVKFSLRNLLFEIPYFGLNAFLQDARKIIPGMTREDLTYAKGYGGVRPQLIDKKKMALIMGEGKILGDRIIFNITPSPGGTTCLGNGETDMRTICKALGASVNEEKFRRTLLEGQYPIDYVQT